MNKPRVADAHPARPNLVADKLPKVVEFPCERLLGQYHGSGCTLASACAVGLGQGLSVQEAVELALEYTWQALSCGFVVGKGQLIPDRMHLMQHLEDDGDDGDENQIE